MSALRIALLGATTVARDDQPAPLALTGKPLALLAFLAVESDRAHHRATLASLLWPEQPEDRARHSLRQALLTLRSVLDEADSSQCVAVTRQTLGITPVCDIHLDLTRCHVALDAAERHQHPDGRLCEDCAGLLETAIAAYRGPFLDASLGVESDSFDEWVRHQRERLHHRIIGAMDLLAVHRERTGDVAGAMALARRQLQLDPWREPAWRRLMRLTMQTGDRSAALAAYADCVAVLRDDLGIAPEAETTALYERIRRVEPDATWLPPAPSPGSTLPTPLTPLVGREREMQEVGALLATPDCRLLSLVGPGGIGKTRLALELAQTSATTPGGAAFVSLETVHTRLRMAAAIADALHISLAGSDHPEARLQRALHEQTLLLVLDNLEQLPDAGALIGDLLRAAPRLTILTTTRARLQVAGEWAYEVRGLPLSAGADVIDAPAPACFLRVARQAGGQVTLDAQGRNALWRICRLVEGMPLALALAAGWTPTLSLPEIAAEITRGIDLLVSAAPDAPARHRSVRAVCDSSWALLTAEEQDVFRRLSVFSGGFSRDAATAVAGASLSILAALLAKSLLRRAPDGRYSLHELLRHYSEERLRDDQAVYDETHDRHCAWFAGFMQRRELRLTSHQQVAVMAEIGADLENVRTAWRWALDRGRGADIVASAHGIWLYYVIRGRMAAGDAFFGEATTALARRVAAGAGDQATVRALATSLIRQGGFRNGLGHYAQARERLEAGIALLRALGETRELGLALNFLAAARHLDLAGSDEEALLRESEELLTAAGDRWALGYTLGDLGIIALGRGDIAAARTACTRGHEIFAALGDRRGLAFACQHLGEIALAAGDLEEARHYFAESLRLRRLADDQWGIVASLMALGVVARQTGALPAARRHLIAALDAGADSQVWPILLDVLIELALVMDQDGQHRAARAIAAPVLAHPSCNAHIREKATHLIGDEARPASMLGADEARERVARLIAALRRGSSGDGATPA